MSTSRVGFVLAFVVGTLAFATAVEAKRVAFVVGNDDYMNVTDLRAAVNDARAIGATLQDLGFELVSGHNLSRREMNARLQEFANKIEAGDEALFFYAGHGLQLDGRNFLLPTDIPDARAGQEGFVKGEAIGVDQVLDMIRSRGSRVAIIVLDACRNNPFPRTGTRSLGGTRGLARMPAPEGTFIMYSAGVGQEALDRIDEQDADPNSVFTRTLIPLLKTPGLKLTETARRARREVQKLAAAVHHQQRPAYYDEVTGEFFFTPGEEDSAAPAASASSAQEETLWSSIVDSQRSSDFDFYLSRYPHGRYSAVAELKLLQLKAQPKEQSKEQEVAVGIFPQKPPIASGEAQALCDSLAADTYDRQATTAGIKKGVDLEVIDIERAVKACTEAVESGAGEARHHYQLGRSLYRAIRFKDAIAELAAAADKGSTAAMRMLAQFYALPQAGLKRDDKKAFEWRLKASEAGDPDAMREVITDYWQGRGVEKDRRRAADWFARAQEAYRKLAEAGDASAMFGMGSLYQYSPGRLRNIAEAVAWFTKAAEKDHVFAIGSIAFLYKYPPYGFAGDKDQASSWENRKYRIQLELANNGDTRAMGEVGYAHDFGWGVPEDDFEAFRWYRRAVDAGDHFALGSLAGCYRYGTGVAADTYQADQYDRRYYDWNLRAGDAGDALAMYFSASAYENGQGVFKSEQKEGQLLRASANLGYVSSMSGLGSNYTYGDDADPGEAYRWYRRAGEEANWSELFVAKEVAARLDSGTGVGRDSKQAAEIMIRAFDQSGQVDENYFKELKSLSAEFRRQFQSLLLASGHYAGTVDGQLGSGTLTALAAYVNRAE